MINEILESIAKNLSCYSGYEVYVDDMEQGVTEPCFLLKFLRAERTPRLDGRYRIRAHFQIVFLAGNASAINDMSESLPFDVRKIDVSVIEGKETVTKTLNAVNMETHADTDEHTLVCLFDYLWTAYLVEGDPDYMLTATIETEVKNG